MAEVAGVADVLSGAVTAALARVLPFGVLLVRSDDAPESAYQPMLEPVLAELVADGTAVKSQGAWCVFLPEWDAPLIVRKRDGGFSYAATDLAALRYRVRELKADRILYLTDARQALHLAQVFATADRGRLADRWRRSGSPRQIPI